VPDTKKLQGSKNVPNDFPDLPLEVSRSLFAAPIQGVHKK